MKQVFVSFFFVFLVHELHAQLYMRNFGVEQGLPSTETYDILQDQKGYIWVSSDRGVSRYDGYSFRNFSTADGLTDNTVFFLQEDAQGQIWCATLNNQLCFFDSGDHIIPYRYNQELQENPPRISVIQSVNITSSGELLLGRQRDGCLQMNGDGVRTDFKNGIHDSSITTLVYATDDYFVYGTADPRIRSAHVPQYIFVQINGDTCSVQIHPEVPTYYATALRKKDGTILVSTANIVLEVTPDFQKIVHRFEATVIRMTEDTEGNVWIGMYGQGVRKYPNGSDLSGNDYSVYLAGENVTDVLQDDEGGYWMSTLDHGLFFLASDNVHGLLYHNSITGNTVNAITGDGRGHIFIGTNNGWVHACTRDSVLNNFNFNSTAAQTDLVQEIFCAPGGDLRICTNKLIRIVHHGAPGDSLARYGFGKSICSDNAGGTWIGGLNSILHFTGSSAQPDRYLHSNHWIQELYFDSISDKLLVGTLEGLYWLDSDTLAPYMAGKNKITARVSAIRRAGNKLVVGTIGDGVCLLTDDSMQTVGIEQGLCSPMINDLDVDEHGVIWAATNAGVSRIDCIGRNINVHCYSTYHGLPTNEVGRIFCEKEAVWIGTNSGAAWFLPAEIATVSLPPPIYILGVSTRGEQASLNQPVSFSYAQDNVVFSFLGISYRSNGNTLYRYRIASLDTSWEYTYSRTVEFASLPPGEYAFEVMARNGDGVWSSSPAVFRFSIEHPFWQTWWFRIIVVLMLAACVWWIFTQRIKRLRKNAQQRGLLAEYQHQALAAQMNPHFIFNSLTAMQAFILDGEKEKALKYVDRFAFLMRKSMEHSVQKFVPLEKDVELLRVYFELETARFEDRLTCSINIAPDVPVSELRVPAMIVQPFAENAIRHGVIHRGQQGGRVDVRFEWKENQLWCCIEDNGVGRARSAEINRSRRKHTSFGASITQERLRLLCEVTHQQYALTITDKTDADQHPTGTIIYFMLPSLKNESHA